MVVEFFMPKMSDHMESGVILSWLVQEGDKVEEGQPILEIETDKANVELEAPSSGILRGIRLGLEPGVEVPVGETIAFIAGPDEDVPILAPLPTYDDQILKKDELDLTAAPKPMVSDTHQPTAVPAVRRLAKELDIDLNEVIGSGSEGRIMEQDVLDYEKRMVKAKVADSEGKLILLSSRRRVTGERLLKSVHEAPHFYLSVEVNANPLEIIQNRYSPEIEAETGYKLSISGVLVKVAASALKKHPQMNARYEQGNIRLLSAINIGLAIATDEGLIVPVIHNADEKSIKEVAVEVGELREKASQATFRAEDLSGSSFTITNLGMFGIHQFNAIINPPESAIIAVGRIVKKPVVENDEITIRPMINLTLSIDHRLVDGAEGAKFLSFLARFDIDEV